MGFGASQRTFLTQLPEESLILWLFHLVASVGKVLAYLALSKSTYHTYKLFEDPILQTRKENLENLDREFYKV